MNIRRSIVLLALASAACTSFAADDAMKTMRKMCAEFDQAITKKNMAWFENTATANYVEMDSRGHKVDRKTAMEQMKGMFQMMSVAKASSTVVEAHEKGGAITATVTTVTTGKMKMPNKSKASDMVAKGTYSQHWIKEGGQWKIEWLKATKQEMTVDGKPFTGM